MFDDSPMRMYDKYDIYDIYDMGGRPVVSVQKSIRIPAGTAHAIEEIARTSRRDFSSVANEMLEEAVKMWRCPGIIFADGPSSRRARVAGTGLEVWEIISTYNGVDRDLSRLRQSYHWLDEIQLRAALAYYAAYTDEIDRRIQLDETWTKERLAEEYPILSPRRS